MQEVIVVKGEEILFATQAYVLANCFFFDRLVKEFQKVH